MNAYLETVEAQRAAANPARSAFVLANAGTGKTYLLINRVARLLLTRTPPEKILCITFTKAAAAEMSERLFAVLGEWALSDDETLQKALDELEGSERRQRSESDLAIVRRLFAQALETPGGLKIQTIHAFCESTLRRFPLEAGVAPGFVVLEDGEARALIDAGLDALAAQSSKDTGLRNAFATLSGDRSERDVRALLSGGGVSAVQFEELTHLFHGAENILSSIAGELGAEPEKTDADQINIFVASLDNEKLHAAREAFLHGGANAQKFCAKPLGVFFDAGTPEEKWAALAKLFTKTDGNARGKYGDKKVEGAAPWVEPYFLELEKHFFIASDRIKAARILEDTRAYVTLKTALVENYKAAKAMRAALDFDDLVALTRKLFKGTDAAWIMYKLDHGIEHILVDEAQDTSPPQWSVIEAPLKEFFAGEGAQGSGRTFFAVGDTKQSIYSFQGADAGLFREKEQDLGRIINTVADYRNVELTLSFRTAPAVLNFVDALFADEAAAEGLGDFPIPRHDAFREGSAGQVELWPLTPRPKKADTDPWDAPVDAPTVGDPARLLSDRIAQTIKEWLQSDAILESKNRPIEADDVMVLVQSRGRLFGEIIRSLARANVPVAGADRLKLLEDPAVEDILSYARFALTPNDDLSLAEIFKSPFFGFDEDALFELAHNRNENQNLWETLQARAAERKAWSAARSAISEAVAIAHREGPVHFIAHLLEAGAPSGRAKLFQRLGQSSSDAIDEVMHQALQFETENPRNLRAFLSWFEQNAGEIKREMERNTGAVRVMTVHGAKGLESEIVFLLDAHRTIDTAKSSPLIKLTRDPAHTERLDGLPVLVGGKTNDTTTTRAARDEKIRRDFEEYRRLLYVAATRARDRLYICGIESGRDKDPTAKETRIKSWHSLAIDAFDRLDPVEAVGDAPIWDEGDAKTLRYSNPQTACPDEKNIASANKAVVEPDWLHKPASEEQATGWLAPSHIDVDAPAAAAKQSPAYSPLASVDRFFRGNTLHRLLELLPEIAEAERPAAADRLLQHAAPQIDAPERAAWRDEVLKVLNDPQFAPVFGAGSRAEVSIAGTINSKGHDKKFSGAIDRLVVSEDKILVVDYKTNRPPPSNIEDADPAYIAQLAVYRALLQEIYPDHKIDCALLWTYDARLMAVPSLFLDHAIARFVTTG